jgi:hypothetical protein
MNIGDIYTLIKSLENMPYDMQENFLKSQDYSEGSIVIVRKDNGSFELGVVDTLEKGAPQETVKLEGGAKVTHHDYPNKKLTKYYPKGSSEAIHATALTSDDTLQFRRGSSARGEKVEVGINEVPSDKEKYKKWQKNIDEKTGRIAKKKAEASSSPQKNEESEPSKSEEAESKSLEYFDLEKALDSILEKGRRPKWDKKIVSEKTDDDDVGDAQGMRLVGDRSREYMDSRIKQIRNVGEHDNLKRMAASKDPDDRKYAKKYGYSLD